MPGPRTVTAYESLSPEDFDGLADGVVRLDDAGIVLAGNPAAASLLGVPVGAMAGRDFFRDLAPGANVPRGYGRFLAGVRGSGVDANGTFAFDQAPRPVRADLHMVSAEHPGVHWITMTPVADGIGREGIAEVQRRVRARPVDASQCEREPIHVPGSIQPDAILLVADATLGVVAHSANVADAHLPVDGPLIGRGLDALLPASFVDEIRSALAAGGLAEGGFVDRTMRLPDATGEPFLVVCHAHAGRVLVELEPVPERSDDFGPARSVSTGVAVARLRNAGTVAEVAAAAAREIRSVTGFESVLVYRFDPDWNGEAIAEDMVPDWSRSLLGLHFPASDIPAQARALYLRSRIRFVTDRDGAQVPILADARLDAPIDLSFAQHRSLSPIHLEYQRNLGVNGSMSASIIVGGVLWGMMIGHHRRPHYVRPAMRAVAALLTDAFAMRLQEVEGRLLWEDQQAHVATQVRLVRKLTQSNDFVDALTVGETTMLDLFDTAAAAVVSAGKVTLMGTTPGPDEVLALRDWLASTHPSEDTSFVTHALSAQYEPATRFADRASGLIAVFVDDARDHLLMWFKPEVPSTVSWSGDPNKPVEPDGTAVLPRRSFERWVEERRRQSTRWASWKAPFASSLAQVVEGVVLRQRRMIDDLTGLLAEKERLLEQKDVLSREIDHRVKNSLQIVSAFLQMQQRQTEDLAAKQAFAETSARVMSVARVHDSLYQAENLEEVDLGQTIEILCQDLSGMAGDGQTVGIVTDAKVMVPYRKAVALSLIATELVTNAFKYATTAAGTARVEVSIYGQDDGGVRMRVCDDGEGLPEGWAERKPKGTGLGMRLVRAMLDQIDARLEVSNDPGACFTVYA
ncbi:GAF domain-containing protein [Methylobacterium sp. J-078]|uniref:histidine kinase dimerization/phosphoacceptor domain -containing protein n=1 Tax=Methylobacterium sp. J-078 TaxID=2836657 RepID=UPI001FB8F297|nr:histidine kinase dimerization/phosphoacceptor domain -containing protein [Methylobacterium sp. J-078]MCJ2044055.1 GAF domain-containing protein [Methylobacterium sp. J-078]